MTEDEVAPLARRVAGQDGDELWSDAAKQLVKACLYPEFKICRDSFREVAADGACRRQELNRVRRRVSGTHCVDCPYWVSLTPAQHRKFLARYWRTGEEDFVAHRDHFLPEEFRDLRVWLHAAARQQVA